MEFLTRKEELIMLAIRRLGESASLVEIRRLLIKRTGKNWSPGNVYVPLDSMTKKNFLEYTIGDPSPRRGGKARKIYRLTGKGRRALDELKKVQDLMWTGLPDPTTGG